MASETENGTLSENIVQFKEELVTSKVNNI
jgi:hypothetical protein